MSQFVIFTIVLTILYILYYSVIIAIDIWAKPEVSKATEEVIEIDADDEVTSIVVEESAYGLIPENNGSVEDVENSINEIGQQEEKAPLFDIHIIDEKLQDIVKSYSVVVVSKDMKCDRMKALGVSCSNVMESVTEEEEEDDLEEADMNEIMNAEEKVKLGI